MRKPESNLLPAHVPLIQKAVLAACDMKDGVADGILTDPRTCTWDPGELACKGAASGDCLTPAQVETFGVPTPACRPGWPLRRDAADARRRERLGRADDRHAASAARRQCRARRAVHVIHREGRSEVRLHDVRSRARHGDARSRLAPRTCISRTRTSRRSSAAAASCCSGTASTIRGRARCRRSSTSTR